MARGGGKAQTAPIPCPKCGGAMYDNIADKAAGRRPQKAPDYACKDRENCDHGVWLKDSEKNALQAAKPGAGPQGKRPVVIDSLMKECVVAAKDILAKEMPSDSRIAPELVVNMATTMFIARVGGAPGILKIEKEGIAKAQAKAAEAERVRREEAERKAREQQEQPAGGEYDWDQRTDDDDNPF